MVGEKVVRLRLAMDAALHLRAHGRAQAEEGRKPGMASTPFSWKEQRNLVGILVGESSTSCG